MGQLLRWRGSVGVDDLNVEGWPRAPLLQAYPADWYASGISATGNSGTDQLDERGHRLVVRNGHALPRSVSTRGGGDRADGAAGERYAHR